MKIPKFCGVVFWFQTEGTEKTPSTEKTHKFSERNSNRCGFLITLKVKNTRWWWRLNSTPPAFACWSNKKRPSFKQADGMNLQATTGTPLGNRGGLSVRTVSLLSFPGCHQYPVVKDHIAGWNDVETHVSIGKYESTHESIRPAIPPPALLVMTWGQWRWAILWTKISSPMDDPLLGGSSQLVSG